MLNQIQLKMWPDFIVMMLVLLVVIEFFVLKIGLIITKAEEKTGMKWVGISLGLQIGMILFVGLPMILVGLSGGFEHGPDPFIITMTIIIGLFLDLQVINIIHRLGMKRALIVFGLMIVPIIIISGIITYTINYAEAARRAQEEETSITDENTDTTTTYAGLYMIRLIYILSGLFA